MVFTEPSWDHFTQPGYPQWQADELGRAKAAGAKGLKILKTLGLYLREQITTGPLVKIDDTRFDPMWEACAALGFPVSIHVADPEAFFLPIDRFNERYEELNDHPDWSFHGKDFPSFDELIAARDRVLRAPSEDAVRRPPRRARRGEPGRRRRSRSTGSPTCHVELGGAHRRAGPPAARVAEVLRQVPGPHPLRHRRRAAAGEDTPQQVFGDALYEIYYRFLETEDEYFDYAPAPVPPQGRWRIYGLGLPDAILKKVYHDNAERVLGLKA